MAMRRALMSALFTSATSLADAFQVGGYIENWKAYADKQIEDVDVVYYSFLTLDTSPSPYNPANKFWDGKVITETMTLAPIQDVMKKVQWGPYEWQRVKIDQMIKDCHSTGKKFIWAIGGWSDLVKTLQDDQIDNFATQVVELLGVAGDGVDFDWEHISEGDQNDKESWTQQRHIIGKTIDAVWSKLREAGMSDKIISYTSRFNCFRTPNDNSWGTTTWPSDGECLDTFEHAKVEHVNWVNLMVYDVPAKMISPEMDVFQTWFYKVVLDSAAKVLPKEKIMVGFEPGFQAAGGIWEGFDIDFEVIDIMRKEGYGGIFFWAINEASSYRDPKTPSSQNGHEWQGTTGANSQYIAKKVKAMPRMQEVNSHYWEEIVV